MGNETRMIRQGIRRLAVVSVGALVLVGAVLAGPVAANASSATTTVRGTVTVNGHPLAHVLVGTWSRTRGVLATSHTNARGHFTLHTLRGVTVYAFAGSAPSKSAAVFSLGSSHLVRGVIGASQPKHLAGAIFEGAAPAKPSKLGGGHALKFRLQRAGRFSGASAELGTSADVTGSVLIQRGQSYSDPISATAAGKFTSPWLVPGRYRLFWETKPGVLPARSWVTVRSAKTAHAATPAFVRGATVTARVVQSSAGPNPGAPVAGLPAGPLLPDSGGQPSTSGTTNAAGQIVLTDQDAGTLPIEAGTYYADPDEGIISPNGQATSDDWLPALASAHIGSDHADQTVTIAVDPASHITGTVAAATAPGAPRMVVAENASGVPVRSEYLENDATAFDLGGLVAGTYTVTAIETDDAGHDGRYTVSTPVTVAPGGTTAVAGTLTPATPEPTISGSVSNATSGHVSVNVPNVLYASSQISKAGTYRLTTIPGIFQATVYTDGRVDSSPFSLHVASSSERVDLHAGAKLATVTVRFTVHGHPVPVAASATDGVDAHDFTVNPTGTNGRSTAHNVVPTRYRWSGTPVTLIATDGPWCYSTPAGSFTVRSGKNDLGTKKLMVLH